jgi:methylmalonyl-CoA/ethylmalonyl-CoA epimerase
MKMVERCCMLESGSHSGSVDEQCSSIETSRFKRIYHISLAVPDLEEAIVYFKDILGFTLEQRMETRGSQTGMISAVFRSGELKFVLCQGTEPESSMSRLVAKYGAGIAHIAFEVDDVDVAVKDLSMRGLPFITTVIGGPGLRQVFTNRDPSTGMSLELITRGGESGFREENVKDLFDQLEKAATF